MLRFWLKTLLMAWIAFVILLLAMFAIGRTAPDVSVIAYFSDEIEGTAYWRLDLLTGIAFKDQFKHRFLTDSLDIVPLRHILTIIADENTSQIYEFNLDSYELRFVGEYPARSTTSNYYIILAGDFVFPIDQATDFDWTRIHIPSGSSDYFLDDTHIENARVSPDSRWLAGSLMHDNHLFVNLLDASTYRIEGYCCVAWSPDAHWYIAMHKNREFISVLNADNGEYHPVLPENIAVDSASWARDSQSIFFQDEQHLAEISLLTGTIEAYPAIVEDFSTTCVSPNQRYILSWGEWYVTLTEIQTGEELWRVDHVFTRLPDCFWSEDSRYLSLFMMWQGFEYSGGWTLRTYWQRFFFIDTERQNVLELYPQNMPTSPFYLHLPD